MGFCGSTQAGSQFLVNHVATAPLQRVRNCQKFFVERMSSSRIISARKATRQERRFYRGFMKKEVENEMEDELRSEYDFAQMQGGVRGKYVERDRKGTKLVLLDPDVAQAFPNDAAVNEALRLLIQVAQHQQLNSAVEQTE
jgi:hypothetical protein